MEVASTLLRLLVCRIAHASSRKLPRSIHLIPRYFETLNVEERCVPALSSARPLGQALAAPSEERGRFAVG